MFAQQWGGDMSSKKRGRDDDGDGDVAIGGTEGFTEHRNVRAELSRRGLICPLLHQLPTNTHVNHRNACSPCPSALLRRPSVCPSHPLSTMGLCQIAARSTRTRPRIQ